MPVPIVATTDVDRASKIRSRIEQIRSILQASDVLAAKQAFSECVLAADRLESVLRAAEGQLDEIPPIDVAVLGPSRHGKSTLLNALVSNDLLPTSDIKPCTASILKMTWAPEWTVRVNFVGREQLISEWKSAIADAKEEIEKQRHGIHHDDQVGDPSFVRGVLQRFIQLFRVDSHLPPMELVDAVEQATIPHETARLLGKNAEVKRTDVAGMRKAIAKYLSTSDVYWTIVADCEILGPFESWHPSLSVVDLPGTNDSDPQRTIVTNSVRESATAVAVVTSDSNIGQDIEAWLRHSTVLANFLEASRKRRQRLFIIRTKLDSYHPEIDESKLEGLSEDEETEAYWAAVEAYKDEQTRSYRTMLRDIASPKLPHGDDDRSRQKRLDLLSRIDEIPVFYISALAHEVFEGRFAAGRKTKRQLADYFDESIEKTGIPGLRDFLCEVARNYLSENYYDDLEERIESEVGHLARVFQKAVATAKAEVAGGKSQLRRMVTDVRTKLLPWLREEVDNLGTSFNSQIADGAKVIRSRLREAERMSDRRFKDKIALWSNLHWASLRAAARKRGCHITNRGQSIDVAEDICSVLVDDIIIAWTYYRDDLIAGQLNATTNSLVEQLNQKLATFRQLSDVPEVIDAISQISEQLYGITHQQRLELLRLVEEKIRDLESIRRPSYEIAQEELSLLYQRIGVECGTGCSSRMTQHVQHEAPLAIERIRVRVNKLIETSVSDLADSCADALSAFGSYATDRIDVAVSHVSNTVAQRDEAELRVKLEIADRAVKLLPFYS